MGNQLCKCGKVGEISCPHDERCGKDKQLPADIKDAIELKAEHEAALHFHPVYSPDQNTACRICYRNGAKEYAADLQAARTLLEKAMNSRSLHNVKDYDLLTEIKTFLDGKY